MNQRLTLDLVPQTCWFSNLRSELPRDDWDKLRRATYREANYRCEICGGKGSQHPVECHEKWSYDLETKTQKLEGLIALCPACHEVKHFGLAQVRNRDQAAIAHYQKVNDVTRVQAVQEIKAEFRIWGQRSALEWDLDLTWLADKGIEVELLVTLAEARRKNKRSP